MTVNKMDYLALVQQLDWDCAKSEHIVYPLKCYLLEVQSAI